MKIVIVTEVFAPGLGGVPVFIERLANQLALAGDDVTVLTDTAKLHVRSQKSILPSGVKIIRVPAVASLFNRDNNRMSYNPWRAVKQAFDALQPDCIHMHTPAGLLHKVALRQARRSGIPVVITNHVMPENLTMNLPSGLAKYATKKVRQVTVGFINQTDFLVTPTETAYALLGGGVTIPHRAITNGIDTALYSPGNVDISVLKKFHIHPEHKLLLYTGRLDGEKRVDILIRAFSEVVRVVPEARLVIVGTGLLDRELQQLARSVDVERQTIFTGRVSDEEKINLLRQAAVFVMPSPAELQCISALEALSCDLPIVVANQAALNELVFEQKNGSSFSYPQVSSCTEAIITLLTHPLPDSTVHEYARLWVQRNHDQAITLSAYREVYQSLMKR